MRPISASSALKQLSQGKMGQPSFNSVNRFNFLRQDESPARNLGPNSYMERSRSNSIKRKSQEGPTYATVTGSNPEQVHEGQNHEGEKTRMWVSEVSVDIVKVESLCDKLVTDASQAGVEPSTVPIFGLLAETLKGICGVQKKIVEKISGESSEPQKYPQTENCNFVDLGAIPKKQKQYDNGNTVARRLRYRQEGKRKMIHGVGEESVPALDPETETILRIGRIPVRTALGTQPVMKDCRRPNGKKFQGCNKKRGKIHFDLQPRYGKSSGYEQRNYGKTCHWPWPLWRQIRKNATVRSRVPIPLRL
jgi:hypothetical protein